MSLTKIKKILTSIAVILAFVIILTACAPAEQPSDEQLPDVAAPTRIIIADAPTTHHLNLYVAKEKGIFERYGLDVEIRTVESLAAARDSVITGTTDVLWSCPTVVIPAIAGGAPVRTIAQVKVPCTSVLLVPPDSPIQTYEDLAGKTIAGLSQSCCAVIALATAARDAGVEFNLVTMAGGPAIAALEAGRIDGAILEEPHASIAELKGFRVMFREAGEAIPCRAIYAREGFITENSDALKRMIKALDEANSIIITDPEAPEVVDIAYEYTGAPKEAIINGNFRLGFTTQLDEKGLHKFGEELVKMGKIEENPSGFMFAPEFKGITWDAWE